MAINRYGESLCESRMEIHSKVLYNPGISKKWTYWIMECIMTTSFFVQVN